MNRYARARRVKQELGTHTYRNDGRGGAPRIYKKRSTNVVYVGRNTKRTGRQDKIIQIGRKVIEHIEIKSARDWEDARGVDRTRKRGDG